ncbi:hypothetical protein JYU34_004399 [Plutella xylostella]|uniref:Uncharacterized protein n=1 Tax=Plutella xylostella TaxID=51655 RepID=A0ABQ7QXX6_PLUXY|nr:hypothetical protein JYU34_004399 [Plutella xylostella]
MSVVGCSARVLLHKDGRIRTLDENHSHGTVKIPVPAISNQKRKKFTFTKRLHIQSKLFIQLSLFQKDFIRLRRERRSPQGREDSKIR